MASTTTSSTCDLPYIGTLDPGLTKADYRSPTPRYREAPPLLSWLHGTLDGMAASS